jgi:hypothetical protein
MKLLHGGKTVSPVLDVGLLRQGREEQRWSREKGHGGSAVLYINLIEPRAEIKLSICDPSDLRI